MRPTSEWAEALERGKIIADMRTHGASPAPYRALEMIELSRTTELTDGLAAEREALVDLIMTDEFRAGVYSFNLVQKRARRPVGAPDPKLARKVTKVGVVGAGLMAGQLALLFARKLHVPVVITDVDQARLDKGLAAVRRDIAGLAAKKRITSDEANRLTALVTGSLDYAVFSDAEFVVEAVFEEIGVKKQVFAELEKYVGPRGRAGDQHLLAVGHRDGRRPRTPGAGRRIPLLQPGRGHAAARDRPGREDRRCNAGNGFRGREAAEEGTDPGPRMRPGS